MADASVNLEEVMEQEEEEVGGESMDLTDVGVTGSVQPATCDSGSKVENMILENEDLLASVIMTTIGEDVAERDDGAAGGDPGCPANLLAAASPVFPQVQASKVVYQGSQGARLDHPFASTDVRFKPLPSRAGVAKEVKSGKLTSKNKGGSNKGNNKGGKVGKVGKGDMSNKTNKTSGLGLGDKPTVTDKTVPTTVSNGNVSSLNTAPTMTGLDLWRNVGGFGADLDDEDHDEDVDEDAGNDGNEDDSAKKSNRAEGSTSGSYSRTPAQRARASRKRKRYNSNKKARLAAEQSAASLAIGIKAVNLVVPSSNPLPEPGKRRAADAPPAPTPVKKSKLANSLLASKLADYRSRVASFSDFSSNEGSRGFFFSRHVPIDLPTLRGIAHTLGPFLDDHSDVIAPNHPTEAIQDVDGLLTLALSGTGLSTVSAVSVTGDERSGAVRPSQPTFFSSEIFDLGRRISCGANFHCIQCQSSHTPMNKTKIVLVTGSEVIASAGLPISLTLPSAPQVEIQKVSPEQCWDSVWVLGGLRADPFKVLKAIYGNYQGGLVVLLDMGTLPVMHGESAASVNTRLIALEQRLVQGLRHSAKGSTRVLVLPPLFHLGDQELALHQAPPRPITKLVLSQLIELKRLINANNSEITRARSTPLHTWGEFVSTVTSELCVDGMGRTTHEVRVRQPPTTVEGSGGVLHLKPDSLHNMVRSLVAFVGCLPWVPK